MWNNKPKSGISCKVNPSSQVQNILDKGHFHYGLKHNDYPRYTRFLNHKIRKLRKKIPFSYAQKHKKVYKFKSTNILQTKHPLLAQIILLKAEKYWSQGMESKYKNSSRSKFTLRKKLKKCLVYARLLRQIVKGKSSERTERQAQGYQAYMIGNKLYEQSQWQKAMQAYECAIKFKHREDIQQKLKFIYYKLKKEQTINRYESEDIVGIQFHGQNIPHNQEMKKRQQRLKVLEVQLKNKFVQENLSEEQLESVFLKVMQEIEEGIKKSNNQLLMGYYKLKKLLFYLQKYKWQINQWIESFDQQIKKSSPYKVIKLCDHAIQIIKNIIDIQHLNKDPTQRKKVDFHQRFIRIVKSWMAGIAYNQNQKGQQAEVVLQASIIQLEQVKRIQRELEQQNINVKPFIQYEKVEGKIHRQLYKAKMMLLEEEIQANKTCKKIENIQINQNDVIPSNQQTIYEMFLQGKIGRITQQSKYYRLPPSMVVPEGRCVFFDIGDQLLEYPRLQGKKKEQQKGFWNRFNIFKR